MLKTACQFFATAIVLVTSASIGVAAYAEPRVERRDQYYEVSAETVSELLIALKMEVPDRPDGEIFHGYTKSAVHWQPRLRQRAGRCELRDVHSVVHIEMTLPRLVWTSHGSEVDVIWPKWFSALQRHEEQHANNAIQVARRGEMRFRALRPQPSCELLKAEASRLQQSLRQELRRLDRDYDERTGHGDSEGAALRRYLAPAAKASRPQDG